MGIKAIQWDFIVRRLCIGNKAVRALLVKGKMVVDGEIASVMKQTVGPFTWVVVDGNIVNNANLLT
jgi:hypothetical protein